MGYQNFYATKLYTDINVLDTTITLDQAPTETSGRLVLEARNPTQREIIKYTGVSGNQITGVLRGQGDTTAKTHVKGSLVEMNVTAEDLDDALGVPNNIVTRFNESLADFVASGLFWFRTTGLNGSMTSGVVYINGNRLLLATVASYDFPASKDIYVDVDVAGTIIYTPVANGAVSGFTLGANSVRLAKVVTDASAIINIIQTGTDILGNYLRLTASIVKSLLEPVHHNALFWSTTGTGSGQLVSTQTSANFDTSETDAVGIRAVTGTAAYMIIARDGVYKIDAQVVMQDASGGFAKTAILWLGVSYDGTNYGFIRTTDRSYIGNDGSCLQNSWVMALPAGARVTLQWYANPAAIRWGAPAPVTGESSYQARRNRGSYLAVTEIR